MSDSMTERQTDILTDRHGWSQGTYTSKTDFEPERQASGQKVRKTERHSSEDVSQGAEKW